MFLIGRKRNGRIVMLMTEGKEQETYKRSQSTRRSIFRAIVTHADRLQMYQHNPRLVPMRYTPQLKLVHIITNDYVNPHARKQRKGSAAVAQDMSLLSYDEAVRYKSRFNSHFIAPSD